MCHHVCVPQQVQQGVLGLVIGKEGSNLQRVRDETGVARITVDRKTCTVRIRGDDAVAVQNAKDRLSYVERTMQVAATSVGAIMGRGGETIRAIRRDSGVLNLRVGRKEEVKDGFLPIFITGTTPTVDSAMLLIQTKLEYEAKLREAVEEERRTRAKLSRIDQEYGDGGYGVHDGFGDSPYAMRWGDVDDDEPEVNGYSTGAPRRNGGGRGGRREGGRGRGGGGGGRGGATDRRRRLPEPPQNQGGGGGRRGGAAAPPAVPAGSRRRGGDGAGAGGGGNARNGGGGRGRSGARGGKGGRGGGGRGNNRRAAGANGGSGNGAGGAGGDASRGPRLRL